MLQDPRADRFINDFVYQWLDLEKLKIVEPDLSIFTVDEFDLVRDQISKEPVAFFKEVLSSNLGLENFIDSDFVMITPELNYVYRIQGHPVAKTEQATGCAEQDIAKGLPSQADHLQVHQSEAGRQGSISRRSALTGGIHADDHQ